MNSDEGRNHAGSNWIIKGLLFAFSAALAGVGGGASLGFIGSLLSADLRIALASLLGIVAVVIGLLEFHNRTSVLQCDRETPQSWIHDGPVMWPIKNGLALGCGATTRIGFWLWYAIPVGSVLVGRVDLGALIYVTYSVTRGMAVWIILFILTRWVQEDWALSLLKHRADFRLLSSAHLVLLGLFIIVRLGL